VSVIDEVIFLRKIQRILEEGDFVATYKFALLHALADLCVENEPEPDGTLRLSIDQLAEKYIEYYWRQARPFRHGRVLQQNTGRQAAIVNRVSDAHARYEISLTRARSDIAGWRSLRARVSGTIEGMPLWRLQTVGDQVDEFLYKRASFENRHLRLEAGVATCFRAFHAFIVNMVRGAWIEQLLKISTNRDLLGEQGDLSAFLFGSERQPLQMFRRILRSHQSGYCFYCGDRVKGEGVLDHFIPWVKYPVDLGHNFVFTDGRCNAAKRDHLAAPGHLVNWKAQNLDRSGELDALFGDAMLRYDARRSLTITAWAYEQAEMSASRVWQHDGVFCSLDSGWRTQLGCE